MKGNAQTKVVQYILFLRTLIKYKASIASNPPKELKHMTSGIHKTMHMIPSQASSSVQKRKRNPGIHGKIR